MLSSSCLLILCTHWLTYHTHTTSQNKNYFNEFIHQLNVKRPLLSFIFHNWLLIYIGTCSILLAFLHSQSLPLSSSFDYPNSFICMATSISLVIMSVDWLQQCHSAIYHYFNFHLHESEQSKWIKPNNRWTSPNHAQSYLKPTLPNFLIWQHNFEYQLLTCSTSETIQFNSDPRLFNCN
jgi:hypothetical protein